MPRLIRIGNTVLLKASENILKVYQIAQKQIDAFPDDASRFPNFKQGSGHRPIYARGAAGPIEGAMNLAEYFVSIRCHCLTSATLDLLAPVIFSMVRTG